MNHQTIIYQRKMQENSQEQKMIAEQIDNLIRQRQDQIKRNTLSFKNASIWSDANYQPKTVYQQANKHNFNIYADKLLIHLVIEQQFNFDKISQIMTYTFENDGKQYSSLSCRQRWYEIHRDRGRLEQIKEKQMQNKRIKSIMSFNDPFILYNIDQKLHKMQKDKKKPNQTQQVKYIEVKYQGYSIFKDSIRKIDDYEKYNQLQKHMKKALEKASKSVQLQKPMLYTPYYDRLQQFQVLEQELTLQKMQQMMSHPIEMELMQRQLKAFDLNQRNFESKIKKEVEKKVKKQKIKNEEQFQIQQNWDEYESD